MDDSLVDAQIGDAATNGKGFYITSTTSLLDCLSRVSPLRENILQMPQRMFSQSWGFPPFIFTISGSTNYTVRPKRS